MEKRKVLLVGGAAALGIAVLFMMRRQDVAATDNASNVVNNPFTAPYVTDGKQPGAGFQSNVNVNVNANAFAGLANQYMPVFGFVGVGVTGSLPKNIININTINTPPQQVVQASVPVAGPPIKPPAPSITGWGSSPRGLPNGYYDLTGASPRGLTSNLRGGGSSFGGG